MPSLFLSAFSLSGLLRAAGSEPKQYANRVPGCRIPQARGECVSAPGAKPAGPLQLFFAGFVEYGERCPAAFFRGGAQIAVRRCGPGAIASIEKISSF